MSLIAIPLTNRARAIWNVVRASKRTVLAYQLGMTVQLTGGVSIFAKKARVVMLVRTPFAKRVLVVSILMGRLPSLHVLSSATRPIVKMARHAGPLTNVTVTGIICVATTKD